MFRASSLLLITITLNTLLGSSTPRPVNVILHSEEAALEELAPVSEIHENLHADKHSLPEELSPAAAGEATVSPEEEPAGAPAENPVSDETDRAESQDADGVESLASEQQEAAGVEGASVEPAAAAASPGVTPEEEIDPTGTRIPAEYQPQNPTVPLEAGGSTDGADTDANTETQEDSLHLSPAEGEPIAVTPAGPKTGASQEEDQEEDQEEASPSSPSETEGEEETSESAAESVENFEVAPNEEQAPPQEESGTSLPLEGQVEPNVPETAAADVVFSVSVDSEEEPEQEGRFQEETIQMVSAESEDQDASDEQAQVDTEEGTIESSPDSAITLEEDQAVAVISEVKEESRDYPAIFTQCTCKEELEEKAQEEPVEQVSLEETHQEGSEGAEAETDDVQTPNSPNDGTPSPGSSEEAEAVVVLSDVEENNEGGPPVVPETETQVETKLTATSEVLPAAPGEDQMTFDLNEERHEKAAGERTMEESPISVSLLEDRAEDSEGALVDVQAAEAAAQPEEAEPPGEGALDQHEDPQEVQWPAPVNRGAVLGAALFTLLSFITMGFVWTTVAKKLR